VEELYVHAFDRFLERELHRWTHRLTFWGAYLFTRFVRTPTHSQPWVFLSYLAVSGSLEYVTITVILCCSLTLLFTVRWIDRQHSIAVGTRVGCIGVPRRLSTVSHVPFLTINQSISRLGSSYTYIQHGQYGFQRKRSYGHRYQYSHPHPDQPEKSLGTSRSTTSLVERILQQTVLPPRFTRLGLVQPFAVPTPPPSHRQQQQYSWSSANTASTAASGLQGCQQVTHRHHGTLASVR
jgi:hypothetical protein